jgi:hypothetical protein
MSVRIERVRRSCHQLVIRSLRFDVALSIDGAAPVPDPAQTPPDRVRRHQVTLLTSSAE